MQIACHCWSAELVCCVLGGGGSVYTSMHEGAASLQRYPKRGKDKTAFLSSLLLPLGLFVSLQPRLNQFWVGSHADIRKIRLHTNEQSINQLPFLENKGQAERWEGRLKDGWRRRRRRKSSEMEIRKSSWEEGTAGSETEGEIWGDSMAEERGKLQCFGVSLCQKGGYSFPGPSPLASCLTRTSWRYCGDTKTHPYE